MTAPSFAFGVIYDTPYKIFLLTHIVAVVVAFGPTLTYAIFARLATGSPGETGKAMASTASALDRRFSLPALVIAMLAGIALVVQSDGAYTFDKPWISGAFTIVLLLALVSRFMLAPALRRLEAVSSESDAEPDKLRSARVSVATTTGLFHIGLIVLVVLMIWKPGQV